MCNNKIEHEIVNVSVKTRVFINMQHYMCKIGKTDRQIWLTVSLIVRHVCFFKDGIKKLESVLHMKPIVRSTLHEVLLFRIKAIETLIILNLLTHHSLV